jgi:hypothetical protein
MKVLAWIIIIWTAIRAGYFLFDPSSLDYFSEGGVIFYLIYFSLVIWYVIARERK